MQDYDSKQINDKKEKVMEFNNKLEYYKNKKRVSRFTLL